MLKIFKDPIFRQVFYFNLVYANPTVTANTMKKNSSGKDPNDLFKRILMKSYILSSILVLVIYSFVFVVVPFEKVPYFLDYTFILFLLLCILQTFTYFYNIFYNSKDTTAYMSLPIEESLIYKAKIAVVSVSTIPMAIPILSLVAIYGFRLGLGPISILYGLLDFILVGILIVVIDMILMELLAKTSILSGFRNGIITAINILATVSNLAIIILIQVLSKEYIGLLGTDGNVRYGLLSGLCKSHKGNLLIILIFIILVLIGYFMIMRQVGRRFYDYILNLQEVDKNKKHLGKKATNDEAIGVHISNRSKYDKKNRLSFSLIKYNLSLINEPTVITQSIVMSVIMPVLILVPNMINSRNDASMWVFIYSNKEFIASIIAILMAIFINGFSTNLSSIIVSLDRENYNYIKSLPISRKFYFRSKLYFSIGVSSVIPLVIMLGGYIYIDLSLIDIGYSILIYGFLSISLASYWLMYDFKNVFTDWQNISDIYGRMNKMLTFVFTFLGFVACMVIALSLGFVASTPLSHYLRHILALLVFIVFIVSKASVDKFLKKYNC